MCIGCMKDQENAPGMTWLTETGCFKRKFRILSDVNRKISRVKLAKIQKNVGGKFVLKGIHQRHQKCEEFGTCLRCYSSFQNNLCRMKSSYIFDKIHAGFTYNIRMPTRHVGSTHQNKRPFWEGSRMLDPNFNDGT